jgi:hypothetical protein
MVETILNNHWPASTTSFLTYALMIVFAPVISFLGIKLLLLAKAASSEKKPREWVFTQERDSEGLPILATAKVRSARTRIR